MAFGEAFCTKGLFILVAQFMIDLGRVTGTHMKGHVRVTKRLLDLWGNREWLRASPDPDLFWLAQGAKAS